MTKILPNKPIHQAVNKLCMKYKSLFAVEDDVHDLLIELQEELEFMLSSCVRYKTGRLIIKGAITIDDDEFLKYLSGYKPGMRSHYHDLFVTREPGIRRLDSHNHSDFELLDEKNIFLQGDIYWVKDESETIYLARQAHFNRLIKLSKEEKHCKVNTDNVLKFMYWLEKLSNFKNKLSKFQNTNRRWNSEDSRYSPTMLFANVMSELNVNLSHDTLEKLENRFSEIAQEKDRLMYLGKQYLQEMQAINKNFRVILQLTN
jgi:hypothetical protein